MTTLSRLIKQFDTAETEADAKCEMYDDGYADLGWHYDERRGIVYSACCRRCEERYDLLYEVEEFSAEGNFCGRSILCIP